jgi:hypothetical protein
MRFRQPQSAPLGGGTRLAEGELGDEDGEDEPRDDGEGLVPRGARRIVGEDEGVDHEHDEVQQHDEDDEDL